MKSNAVAMGKKVYLRPLLKSDVSRGWVNWVNDIENSRYLDTFLPHTEESLLSYIELSQKESSLLFAVCEIGTEKHVGNAKLGQIDWINRRCSYGRLIGDPGAKGKGIGTEVLELLQEYAFCRLGMNRIWTGVVAQNMASIKSNLKAGMLQEGIQKQALWKEGQYIDVVLFGLTVADYYSRRKVVSPC